MTDLFNEFPQAEIRRDDDLLQSAVNALLESIAGQAHHRDLPLDVQGTAFQMRVWWKNCAGRIVSYSELAGQIGKPTAARAVGRACATNPVAIITPCH